MELLDVLVTNVALEFAHCRSSLADVPYDWSSVVYYPVVDNLGLCELIDARRKFIVCYTSLSVIWYISFEVFAE